jgi:hypothetical protein
VLGTLCKGDAAPRLIELGARFLYVSHDAWTAKAGSTWLRGLREAESR